MSASIRPELAVAFAALRKRGLVARQGFSCCATCAGTEIAGWFRALPGAKAEKILGCVTYSRQGIPNAEDGRLFLQYGRIESWEGGKVVRASKLSTVEVGRLVAEACAAAGLKVTWDGDPTSRVLVEKNVPEVPA